MVNDFQDAWRKDIKYPKKSLELQNETQNLAFRAKYAINNQTISQNSLKYYNRSKNPLRNDRFQISNYYSANSLTIIWSSSGVIKEQPNIVLWSKATNIWVIRYGDFEWDRSEIK